MKQHKILLLAVAILLTVTSCTTQTNTTGTGDIIKWYSTGEIDATETSSGENLETNIETPMTKYEAPAIENGDIIATIKTNNWTIKLKIYKNLVPKTAINFIWLSEEGYYTDVIFHRVIQDFMIQWGDPDGTGSGWESIYWESFEDEFDPSLKNDRGTIAMANSWPATNGSQFFINVVNNNFLDNKHTVFGVVVEGMDTVDKISKMKTDASDRPENEVKMIDVNIQTYNEGKYTDYEFNLETELSEVEKISAERDAAIAEEMAEKAEANKDRVATDTDQVVVHYKGALADGTTFDSSYDRNEPIEVNLAENQVIPWFKQEVIGMKIGEKKTVTLSAADAYGEYSEENTQEFPLTDLTAQGITPIEGETVPSMMWELKVLKVTEETVTLDVNHPLAGETLTFDLELVNFVN